MSTLRAYRFQLRCKPAHERQLRRISGCLRWVWNAALGRQQERHAAGEKYAGYAQMCQWLTAWRNDPATAWLAQAPIHPQQQVLRRLDEAYKRFFAQQGGFPKFCRRGEEPGIRFPDPKQFALDQGNGRIKLPKLGWMRLRQSRPVEGTLKNVSLRREGQRWFCSIQVEQPETLPAAGVKPTLGIDLGLALFAATSDGQEISPLKALECQQRRLRRYQKALSRKKKGSANRRKAVDRLARLHRRIAHQRSDWLHQRSDWLHQLTTGLADRHPVIAIEDLKILNMSVWAQREAEPQACGEDVRRKAAAKRRRAASVKQEPSEGVVGT